MLTIVKVGGSLFDWPELVPRLTAWLGEQSGRVVIVPGGGTLAHVIRDLDRHHNLGEEKAHWLALRAMTLNGELLHALLPGTARLDHPRENEIAARAILNVLKFAETDEERSEKLPHSWSATSDSVAARAAIVADADRLVLLKSAPLPPGVSWEEAGRRGYVDTHFAEVVRKSPRLEIACVNFRALT
jgi:aspartokinase-like uncharacterized kinase